MTCGRATSALCSYSASHSAGKVGEKHKQIKLLPSAWHHLTQHKKTRQSRTVLLHIVAGPSSSAVQMEELLGLGLGCCCFLQSVFLGPLVDEKGRTQRPRQPLPQASFSPPNKSPGPWNEHNAMQLPLVCQWFLTRSGPPSLFVYAALGNWGCLATW